MKKLIFPFIGFAMALFLLAFAFSCRNEKVDISRYMAERDSLVKDNTAKQRELDGLNDIITTVASSLDSIAAQEHILYEGKTRDGIPLGKQQIVANINTMAEMLARQRRKIQSLQDSLANKKPSQGVMRLQKVIEFLNNQLAEKDKVIKSLRTDLSHSKKDITQLRTSLSNMQTKIDKAEKKTEVLSTALSTQDNIINECYVKIGTKKQLVSAGLLKGGFLSKKKVNYNAIDKNKFSAVDIRSFREVTLKSSNPKILTPQPNNSSYHFEDNGNGTCTLVITNPTTFWSVSNFLIIQL